MTADPLPMHPTPADVREAARRAGLKGKDAAELCGVVPRTWRKWCGGERKIPPAAWFALLVKTGQHPDYVKRD